MTVSLRKIAMDMDPCPVNKPISFHEIGKLHRWGYDTFQSGVPYRPDGLSLRYLDHKHSRRLKFLWLNAYMLPNLKLDTPVWSGQVFDGAPAISSRAYEIGKTIKKFEYEIVALCEIFTVQSKDTLLSAWESTPYWARGPGEGSVNFKIKVPIVSDIPIIGDAFEHEILTVETISSGLLTVLPGSYGLLSHSIEKFDAKGDPARDADAWSNKGVLKVVADTGFNTKLEIYSTHLIYGGGLVGDISSDERYKIQRKQLDQLISFIERERNPANFLMVVGDFNIYASEEFYQELRWRMEEKLDLEDIWTRYAESRYGAKIGKTNDPSSCTLDKPPCENFADDKKNLDKINEEGRIDYVFIQKPSASHDMAVDISRPRRVPFKRLPTAYKYDAINYFSDHVGIEFQLFLSSKHFPAHPNIGG
jgi:endonuclease/exonuclease/phosphatase family metal-dependent hydrolase